VAAVLLATSTVRIASAKIPRPHLNLDSSIIAAAAGFSALASGVLDWGKKALEVSKLSLEVREKQKQWKDSHRIVQTPTDRQITDYISYKQQKLRAAVIEKEKIETKRFVAGTDETRIS
jgi:hypothetical protein